MFLNVAICKRLVNIQNLVGQYFVNVIYLKIVQCWTYESVQPVSREVSAFWNKLHYIVQNARTGKIAKILCYIYSGFYTLGIQWCCVTKRYDSELWHRIMNYQRSTRCCSGNHFFYNPFHSSEKNLISYWSCVRQILMYPLKNLLFS